MHDLDKIVVQMKSDIQLFSDFEAGIVAENYSTLEKIKLTIMTFEKSKKIMKKLNVDYDFNVSESRNDIIKIAVYINKETQDYSIETLFRFIQRNTKNNKKGRIATVMSAKNHDQFRTTVELDTYL